MHLPGPLRAAVGLVAFAAEEAKHLPDRAIELPMLAVSSVLQMSLRAQQRYARLAARGDQVLNRTRVGDEPPQWATFDEPVSVEDLSRAGLAHLDSMGEHNSTSRAIEDLFGEDTAGEPAGEVSPEADEAPDTDQVAIDEAPDNVTPIAKAKRPAKRSASQSKTGPARRSASSGVTQIKKSTSAAKATPARKSSTAANAATSITGAPATEASSATESPSVSKASSTSRLATAKLPARKPVVSRGKTVNTPRHTTPSKFDDVDD